MVLGAQQRTAIGTPRARPGLACPTVHRGLRLACKASVSTSTPTRTLTSDLMEAAITLALRSRLREYTEITPRVSCSARDLMEGRFEGMQIIGRGWRTPLELTAQVLEVEVGDLAIDLPGLLWQQRLQLVNMPLGATAITLTARDLGNFMVHPLMAEAGATAVQGQAFLFDKDTVTVTHDERGGEVRYQGAWAGDGKRYEVTMRPKGASGQGRLSVGARALQVELLPDGKPDLAGVQAVSQGLVNFFTHMAIDLQGCELAAPAMAISPAPAGRQEDLLRIAMKLRIRSFPPLNMKF